MTEREYIDATNLCKVRLAELAMRDYHKIGVRYDKYADKTWRDLEKLREALEKNVQVTQNMERGGVDRDT